MTVYETIEQVLKRSEDIAKSHNLRVQDTDVCAYSDEPGQLVITLSYGKEEKAEKFSFSDDQAFTKNRRIELEFAFYGIASMAADRINRKQGGAA